MDTTSPMTRLQFLGCLYDETMCPMRPGHRTAWKTLFEADPLAAYMLGRDTLVAAPSPPPPPGLLSLSHAFASRKLSMTERRWPVRERAPLSIVSQFVGQKDSYGVIANLCRASAPLTTAPFLNSIELSMPAFELDVTKHPTPHEMYALYWKIERCLAMHGFYGGWVKAEESFHAFILSRPLFTDLEVDWKVTLKAVHDQWARPAVVPHLHSLTFSPVSQSRLVPAAGKIGVVENTEENAARLMNYALRKLRCPNLIEFYAPQEEVKTGSVTFLQNHPNVRRFICPSWPSLGSGMCEELQALLTPFDYSRSFTTTTRPDLEEP